MGRSARAILVLVLAAAVPACNLTSFQEPQAAPASGSPFMLQLPLNGSLNVIASPQLVWSAAPNAQSYQLQISLTSDFSRIIIDQPGIPITSAFVQASITNFTNCWWRVYAVQPGGGTLLAGGSPFQFRTLGGGFTTPTRFSTLTPTNGLTVVPRKPTFAWQEARGAVSYTLQVDFGTNFLAPLVELGDIHLNQVICPVTLAADTGFSWRVVASGSPGTTISDAPPSMFATGP